MRPALNVRGGTEHRGLFIGRRAEDHRRYRGLFDQHRRAAPAPRRRRRPGPKLDSQGQLIAAVERDAHDMSAAQALVVANDDQLIEMPAVLADGGAVQHRGRPFVIS